MQLVIMRYLHVFRTIVLISDAMGFQSLRYLETIFFHNSTEIQLLGHSVLLKTKYEVV